jgi:hypothetical protein
MPSQTPTQKEILKHYTSPTVVREIIKISQNREIGGRTAEGQFMKRPSIIQYPSDLVEKIKSGVVAFHCSVEHWNNPMVLSPDLRPAELDELRKGWDLIIDIDAKAKLEHSKIAAIEIIDYLKTLGITPTVKFSGRRGFHIAIANNAFPEEVNFNFISKRYPDLPRTIIAYIKDQVRDRIRDSLIKYEGGVGQLLETIQASGPDPYLFVDVEENWGNRHLFRMPYSLHPKTWKVSTPIRLFKLKSFSMEKASIGNITPAPFLINKDGEATELLLQALDWTAKREKKQAVQESKPKRTSPKTPIPEKFFPPCMKTLLNGITDGKKRSIFTLITFLKSVNWPQEKVEEKVWEWNKKNEELGGGLSNRFVTGQIRWHERQQREILPANCDSNMFYKSTTPILCEKKCHNIKNPVNYAFKTFLRDKFEKQTNKSVRKPSKKRKKVDKNINKEKTIEQTTTSA